MKMCCCEVFTKASEEKVKAMYVRATSNSAAHPGAEVTSVTDRDLQGRPSFTEKERKKSFEKKKCKGNH